MQSNVADRILADNNYTLCFEETSESFPQLSVYVRGENSADFCRISTTEYELFFCGKAYPASSLAAERSFEAIRTRLERVDGQFSFLLWHRKRRELLAGSDLLAWKALYYTQLADLVLLSDDFSLMKNASNGSKSNIGEINASYISQYILGTFSSTTETTQVHIKRIAPAHHLRVLKSDSKQVGIEQHRYWQAASECSMTRAEAASEVRNLLIDTVGVRKQVGRTVSLMLSGGLDSSVVAICDRQSTSEGSLKWHSMFFPEHDCDESQYITALCNKHREKTEVFEFNEDLPLPCDLERIASEAKNTGNFPNYPNGHLVNLLRSKAAEESDYIMTGYGGDELFSGRHKAHSPFFTNRFLSSFASRLRRGAKLGSKQRYFGLNRTIKLLTKAAQLSREDTKDCDAQSRFSRYRQHTLFSGTAVHYRELETTYSSLGMLHPYYDRRLIDFCFSIPENYFGDFKEYKPLLRSCFSSEIPSEIAHRRDKASFSFIWQKCISNLAIKTLTFKRLAQLGLIDEAEVLLLAAQIADKEETRFEALSLFWNIVAAEQLCAAFE